MSFVRAETYPVYKRAQEEGTFAGLSVTREPGINTANMHYADFAPSTAHRPSQKPSARRALQRSSPKAQGSIPSSIRASYGACPT